MCRMLFATCRPMGCVFLLPFLAAVRRALVLAADLLAQLPPKTRRLARAVTNWDSNTVLNRTWQIPGASTRVVPFPTPEHSKRGRKAALSSRRFAADFVIILQRQVDHGMRASAMAAAIPRENLQRFVKRRRSFRGRDRSRPRAPASHPRCIGHASVTRQRYRSRHGPVIRFMRYSPIHYSPDRRE